MEGKESLFPLFRLPPTVYGPSPNGGFVPTAKGRSFVIKQIGGFVFEKLSALSLQLLPISTTNGVSCLSADADG